LLNPLNCTTARQQRTSIRNSAHAPSARIKIVECCGVFCSDQAQPPRRSECCAELGRKPSNGEPASPRTKIIFARLSSHKRGQCPFCVVGERCDAFARRAFACHKENV